MKKILQLYRDNAGREKSPVNMVRNAGDASLYIYDVIDPDWGVSAAQVIDAVAQAGDADTLHVYINSPGGDVFEGRAIMAALSRFQGKTIAHIDSLCASAATSIALACNEVEMSEGAFFMIHNASCIVWGDKGDLREQANVLEKIEGAIVADYVTKTGKPDADIVAWMDAETWFSAAEALENGFVDRITQAPANKAKTTNNWNLAAYSNAPQAISATGDRASNNAAPALTEPVSDPGTLNADEAAYLSDLSALHEKAIALSKAILPLAESDDVEDLAERVIATQAGQLELMKTWLSLGAAPEPEEESGSAANQAVPVIKSMTQSNRNRLTLLTVS